MAKIAGRLWSKLRLAALAPPLLLAVAVQAEDWPQFRGPNRDSVWSETDILQSFPDEGFLQRSPSTDASSGTSELHEVGQTAATFDPSQLASVFMTEVT